MASELTFSEYISKLTEPYPVMRDHDGEPEVTWEGAMLDRLRAAIYDEGGSGGDGGGGGASAKSIMPINDAALDLLEQITVQASVVLAFVTHTPTPYGHAEAYVAEWSKHTNESTLYRVGSKATSRTGVVFTELRDMTALELVKMWHDRIAAFFDPPKMQPIETPCPECEQRYIYRLDAGEVIRADALIVERNRNTGVVLGARCRNCAFSWARAELADLAVKCGLLVLPTAPPQSAPTKA